MSLTRLTTKRAHAAACGVVLGLLSTGLLAGSLIPDLPPAKPGANQCVEPTDVMRKKHYSFILHQRDETMHKGIRTTKYSLNECIACHVQPREDGSYPKHSDSDHFCNTCHEYAAVSVDCFQCHVDSIPAGKMAADHPNVGEMSQ